MKPRWLLATVFCLSCVFLQAQRTIEGTVTDQAGSPLIGANILVKNSDLGTTTDINGNYSLTLPADEAVLLVSYIGFRKEEVPVGTATRVDVQLSVSSTTLDEVVKWGYGTSSRRELTSSIVRLDQEVYAGASKTNPIKALQGRVPGVQITQASGATQSAMHVRIRGQTSISASNQPLVVIDGVISDAWGGFGLNGPGASKLLGIDPNDIASVEVLKDGAASAIYGARGTNGVILITTRQGTFNARPRVSVSYQSGFSRPAVRPNLMSGPEYARSWNQAVLAAGMNDPELLYADPDAEPTTDWYEVLTRTAMFHDAHASVSGGSASTSYYVSAGYHNEEDYFITKGMQRYSFKARVEQMIGDKWQAGVSVAPSRVEQDKFRESVFLSEAPTVASTEFLPNVAPFDSAGNPIMFYQHKISSRNWNPVVDLKETEYTQSMTDVRLGAHLQFSPFHHLQLRTEFNAEYSVVHYFNKRGARTRLGSGLNGTIVSGFQETTNYNWTNTATWTTHPGADDELVLVVGNQIQHHVYDFSDAFGASFADPRLTDVAAGAIRDGFGLKEAYRFAGFFGRTNYNLRDKYFVALSARFDASSRFGANNRWGFFPALSAGWMISEEPFFQVPAVDFLKLSGSIGQTGNAEISNYASQALLGFFGGYQGRPGSRIISLGNNDLTWEETTQYNLSMSFGLFQEQLEGTVSWFSKHTDGLLLNVPLPASNGIGSRFENVGSVRNHGWEFELASTVRPASDWSLRIGVNGAFVWNRITALADTDGDGMDNDIAVQISPGHTIQLYRVGEPMASWYLVRYAGVDPANGDALFYDLDGNTTKVFSLGDRVIAGRGVPRFTGGITLDADYRRFFLSAVFQTALGYELFRNAGHHLEDFQEGESNKDRRLLDAWTESNTVTDIPESRLNIQNGAQTESTRWLEKADHLRLKHVKVGYAFDVPKGLTVYLAGQNLWLLSGLPGDVDPEEMSTNVNSPHGVGPSYGVTVPRSISFGLKLDLQ
ncbi:MAG: SusC/RagA family TonB-linked outer membrane protein [Saprospiraceae bacterium]|nr:SusC/RagA family TonB-linked outer membrane protein [Saprospiraceae bacterium]